MPILFMLVYVCASAGLVCQVRRNRMLITLLILLANKIIY
jgi:hypothetical protein